jgi:putative Mg2+ transporter-C (MgtC) family protein
MLVAGAAALFVGLGDVLIAHFSTSKLAPLIRSDPYRIIGAIVTGISFLGAGTIFRRHQSEHIEGLTTAASILPSILLASAVGISIALRQMVLALGVTVLVLFVLRGMRFIERWLGSKHGV